MCVTSFTQYLLPLLMISCVLYKNTSIDNVVHDNIELQVATLF